jgi:putative pyrroloquinoline-quinone binding quinoprotein
VTESSAALERYRARMRRPRLVYAAVVAVVVVLLAVFAGVVWSHGEAAHVTLRPAATVPPTLPIARPDQPQHALWRSSDHVALGAPQFGGTVVTYSTHTVRGRDARTGRVTWSYNRSDRTVCNAVQIGGKTMAVYAVHGNCDEVTALQTGNGQRAWTRTLDKDGVPLNGRPTYQWSQSTFLLSTSTAIYAIDPGGGLDRWTYTRFGCRIARAVLGSAGVLISQTCTHPDCSNLDHCGPGPQLLLRDATAGNGDDSKRTRDQVKWNLFGNTDVPVSSDQVVGAVNRTTGRLVEYRIDTGTRITTVALGAEPPSATALAGSVAIDTTEAQVLWLDGVSYALTAGGTTPIWTARSASPPTVVATVGTSVALSTARITVPTSSGITILDGNDGRPTLRFPVPAPPAGSRVYPLGAGFLVATPTGAVAYR